MLDVTTLRFWLGATVAWLMTCILLFDRWFFFSPLGIFLSFCVPAAGWLLWWRYAPGTGQEISPEEQQMLDKALDWLQRIKTGSNRQS